MSVLSRRRSAATTRAAAGPVRLTDTARDELLRRVVEQQPGDDHAPGDLDNGELSVLLAARLGGHAVIDAAMTRVQQLVETLAAAHTAATGSVTDLLVDVSRRSVEAAVAAVAAVEARHAGDGPEDRRRRKVPRWLPYAVIPMVGLVETTFLAAILAQIVDAESIWRGEGLAGLAVGVVIAVACGLAGVLFAEPYLRSHDRRDRGADSDLHPPQWHFPLGFALALAVVLSMWAFVRANAESSGFGVPPVPAVAVVVLMLMLSVTGAALKMLTYNPFADSAAEAAEALESARAERSGCSAAAEQARLDLDTAWLRLRGALDGVRQHVAGQYDDALALVLQARMLTGRCGVQPPTVTRAVPSTAAGRLDVPPVWEPVPAVELPVLAPITVALETALEVLHRYHPDRVEAVAKARFSVLVPEDPTPEPDGPVVAEVAEEDPAAEESAVNPGAAAPATSLPASFSVHLDAAGAGPAVVPALQRGELVLGGQA